MSDPKRLVLASGNAGKLRELSALMADYGYELIAQGELGVGSVPETGTTFVENAIIKARHAAAETGLPALADDSGIEVDALQGAPGVFSARFAGEDANDASNNALLVEKLRDVPEAERGARYRAVIVFMRHAADPAPLIAEGSWSGRIQLEPEGDGGFGYDPYFYLPELGCTSASLSAEEKNRRSHRGTARCASSAPASTPGMFDAPPPLGLYIHLPWCERKCPYCDFNSHEPGLGSNEFTPTAYVDALLRDMTLELPLIWGRRIESIFIGGGTPSLFPAEDIDRLLAGLRGMTNFSPAIEITLEANPGSAEAGRFSGYREAGVNRLSIGVQSFDDACLQRLGRVHERSQALAAFDKARAAGFDNINLDLMFALPEQDAAGAMRDLDTAIDLGPEHLSWYQLTIEPNTRFAHQPPAGLPDDDDTADMHEQGIARLAAAGYHRYEVSAYARNGLECRHNRNYWEFGDYLGIGAGAHGKITMIGENRLLRRVRQRQPRRFLEAAGSEAALTQSDVPAEERLFEFMLNASRLADGFNPRLFAERTGNDVAQLHQQSARARALGLLELESGRLRPTELGFRHLNEIQALFLPQSPSKRGLSIAPDGQIMHKS